MPLNKIRSAQIKDTDHITEAELSLLDPHQNIFINVVNSTDINVLGSAEVPASLTIKGVVCSNTSNTYVATLSGTAGERQVYAVRNANTSIKTWDLEVVSNDTPTNPDRSRKIATIDWSGTQINRVKWNLSSRLQIETQTPNTNGQTVFTLNDIVYTPGYEELLVFVNGQFQPSGIVYNETSSTSITFVSGSGIDTSCSLTFVKVASTNYLG